MGKQRAFPFFVYLFRVCICAVLGLLTVSRHDWKVA
jgi:hypothetical protein